MNFNTIKQMQRIRTKLKFFLQERKTYDLAQQQDYNFQTPLLIRITQNDATDVLKKLRQFLKMITTYGIV